MRNHLIPVVLSVLALTACSADSSLLVDPVMSKNGAAEPNAPVGATFTVTTGSGTTVSYRSTPRNNQGSCDASNGAWTNRGGNTSGPNHEQCTDIVEGATQTYVVTFSEVATYVQARSGNLNLNFAPVCELAEDGTTQCVSRSVQYGRNADWTQGTGVIVGTDDHGGQWTIDLGQIGHEGNAKMLARTLDGLLAERVGDELTYGSATLTW